MYLTSNKALYVYITLYHYSNFLVTIKVSNFLFINLTRNHDDTALDFKLYLNRVQLDSRKIFLHDTSFKQVLFFSALFVVL